jgi:apolipoprotein N-acyltransferase
MPALPGRHVALAVLSGILLTLSFPLPHVSWLGWIALVPLLVAAPHASPRGALLLGWIAGVTFFTGSLHWLTNTMVNYGHLPLWLSYPLLALLTAYLGVYVGLFAVGARVLAAKPVWLKLLAVPALWTTLELTRAHVLTGFPWAAFGYSQATTLPVIQIADTAGVYGVSFVLVFVNAAVALALAEARPRGEMPLPIPVASFAPMAELPFPRRGVFAPLVAAAVVLYAVLAYGHWRLDEASSGTPAAQPFKVAVVQGNIDQDRKWDPAFLRETVDRYQHLTHEQAAQQPDVVLWPEAAMPFFFEREAAHRDELIAFVEREGIPLLFGSLALDAATGRTPRLYNSAYLVSPRGAVAGRYDKLHLVPFGEYVPLASLLFFVDKLVDGIGNFVPGAGPTIFALGHARLGVAICFEVVFPELTRQAVLLGATVMATITNDAWFGESAAPYQHMEMIAFRAVENRVPFARAANTGISGFVDATGRIFETSDLFVPAARIATLSPRTRTTFYTRHGDVFAWICAGVTAAAFWWQMWATPRPPGTRRPDRRDGRDRHQSA